MDKQRIKGLEFHIKNNDYFATLATTLDLLRQDLEGDKGRRKQANMLKRIVKDLMYLQENCNK